jgi:hypothetical protein
MASASALDSNKGPTRAQCRGDTASGQEWFNIWDRDACYNTYLDFIYFSPSGEQWDEDNWSESQGDFISIFNKYLGEGHPITIPGVAGYNSFQETLNSTCLRLPGVCNLALNSFCNGLPTNPPCPNCIPSAKYGCGSLCSTREGIASNAGLVNFCGCHAPLPDVEAAASVIKSSPECDPLCTRINTIKLDNGKGGNAVCHNNTCVISNVSIEAASSDIGGPVTFNQICNQCSEGPCTCIISGVDLTTTGNDVPQLQTQFNQFCGDNSLCLKIETNGTDTPVECQQALESAPGSRPGSGRSLSFWIWSGVILLIFTLIFVVMIMAASSSYKSEKDHTPPVNQSTSPVASVNQSTSPVASVNQSTSPVASVNQSTSPVASVNQSTSPVASVNQSTLI